MKSVIALLIVLSLFACKSTSPSSTVAGTWDWNGGGFSGTIQINGDNPVSGYCYVSANRYDISGTYNATTAHIELIVNGRVAFSATVSKDDKSMMGLYTEIGELSSPQSYYFTATKR